MTSASTPRLTTRGLSLTFGERPVLRDVSFMLGAGEVAVIEGPSGCGKSTLLRAMALLVEPDGGHLSLDGHDARNMAPEVWRRRVAYVFQQSAMFDGSVADNLAAGPRLAGRSLSAARIEELAARVGLARELLERRAEKLSGGERMRVAIARALANEPSVLLLDEPTASLNPPSAAKVVALVQELAASDVGVVVVTHAREHAEALGGTRYAFFEGRLAAPQEPSCTT